MRSLAFVLYNNYSGPHRFLLFQREGPAVTPNFHIFKSESTGKARWIGVQESLGAAKQLARAHGQSEPGEYFIWDVNSGDRFLMTVALEESARATADSRRG
jgi:hypothetical protein